MWACLVRIQNLPCQNWGKPKLGHAKFGCQNLGKKSGTALGSAPNCDMQNLDLDWFDAKIYMPRSMIQYPTHTII